MSRSVIMPTRRPPSETGIEPAFALSMNEAASCTGWSGRTVWTSRVITSLIFMAALLPGNSPVKTNSRRVPFQPLRHVLGQKVVSRDKLVALVEDLDRPADDTGFLALEGLRAHGEF